MYRVYGIPNCDTVQKAIGWLKKHKIPFEFHDYKKLGISPEKLSSWCSQTAWEILLNKKGTTWKQLDETVQAKVKTEKAAIKLMAIHTSMIKRPVIEKDEKLMSVGFDEVLFAKIYGK
ncbi:MAG: hypothetical protein RLZZ28_1213 [Bacteroidota bacterium]